MPDATELDPSVFVNLHVFYAQLVMSTLQAFEQEDHEAVHELADKVKAFKLLFPETAAYFERAGS